MLAAWPALALPLSGADETIRAALDEAAALPPDRALARLRGISGAGASRRARLDLTVAQAGLATDLRLADSDLSPARRFEWRLRRITGDRVQLDDARRALEHWRRQLSAQADETFDTLGLPPGPIGECYRKLWAAQSHLYPDDAAGREAAVAGMRSVLAAIRPRLHQLFGPLPPVSLDLAIRALDCVEIAAGKGGYRILPARGVQGCYVVDLKDIRRRPAFSLASVVAHETLPGHLLQTPLEIQAAPHPLRKRYTTGFTEGWAIYAEMLMADEGLFARPADRLGHIHWMLFRACRGLADIAINVDGRAPDQVLADLETWQGVPAYYAPFETDLASAAHLPASRVADAWVALSIAAARPASRDAWPAYHRRLLLDGPIRNFRARD